jgi:hypothetical protein
MFVKDGPRETPPCPAGASTITAALSQAQPNTTVCTVTGEVSRYTTRVLVPTRQRWPLSYQRCRRDLLGHIIWPRALHGLEYAEDELRR